jgi:hypothetical protein
MAVLYREGVLWKSTLTNQTGAIRKKKRSERSTSTASFLKRVMI